MTATGADIPALHNAADGKPIPFTPVCSDAAVPVCLHPAFRRYLPELTSAVAPLLREVAGLPGAPVRVEQDAEESYAVNGAPTGPLPCFPTQGIGGATIAGDPPVLRFSINALPGTSELNPSEFIDQARLTFVQSVVGGEICRGNLAQQAVQAALLRTAGVQLTSIEQALALRIAPAAPAGAAANRFADLPVSARRAWLATHLPALRAGLVTLGQLP